MVRAAGAVNALSWNAGNTGSSFTDIGTVRRSSDYSLTDAIIESISAKSISAENGEAAYNPVALVRRSTTGGGTVTLFPVPVTASFTLRSTEASLKGATTTMQDVQRREMTRFAVNSNSVDASGWPVGLYLLRLATGEALRFVKH